MYRLDFDAAEAVFRDIINTEPDNPAGYFAVSAIYWWRYSQNFDVQIKSKTLEKEFFKNIDKTINLSKQMLKKKNNPEQALLRRKAAEEHAYFFMGSAYGLAGRWNVVQKHWISAYWNGSKGRKFLKKCTGINPEVYDAYMGLGIFDYYADTLPPALKLPALLFVKGDRENGLRQIRLASQKGKFFSTEARFFLAGILSRDEKDYPQALSVSADLRKTDPSNSFFWMGDILTRCNALDWEGVIEEGNKFLAGHSTGSAAGIAQQLSLIYLSVGDAYLATGRFEEAVNWFGGGIDKTAYPLKGWVTYCYLRRGQALDLLGRREEAKNDYKTALSRDNFWDSRKYAKLALKSPPDYQEVKRQLVETE